MNFRANISSVTHVCCWHNSKLFLSHLFFAPRANLKSFTNVETLSVLSSWARLSNDKTKRTKTIDLKRHFNYQSFQFNMSFHSSSRDKCALSFDAKFPSDFFFSSRPFFANLANEISMLNEQKQLTMSKQCLCLDLIRDKFACVNGFNPMWSKVELQAIIFCSQLKTNQLTNFSF